MSDVARSTHIEKGGLRSLLNFFSRFSKAPSLTVRVSAVELRVFSYFYESLHRITRFTWTNAPITISLSTTHFKVVSRYQLGLCAVGAHVSMSHECVA